MKLKDRVSSTPNRKRLHVETVELDAGGNIKSLIISGIERLDGEVHEEGTKIDAKSLYQALYDYELNGIDPVMLVNIQNAASRNGHYIIASNNSMEFIFDYTGPEIRAELDDSDYFTGGYTYENGRVKVTLSAKPNASGLTQVSLVSLYVNFYLASNTNYVTRTLLSITIFNQSTNPAD